MVLNDKSNGKPINIIRVFHSSIDNEMKKAITIGSIGSPTYPTPGEPIRYVS